MAAWLLASVLCAVAIHGEPNTFMDVVSNPHMPSSFQGTSAVDVAIINSENVTNNYTVTFGGQLVSTSAEQGCQEAKYSDEVLNVGLPSSNGC